MPMGTALRLPVGGAMRCAAVRQWRGGLPRPLAALPVATRGSTAAASASTDGMPSGPLHSAATKGPQPETLFRPDIASLAAHQAGDGDKEGEELREGELPGFTGLPHPDYEAERPQEQTAPEPDNPLPEGLPSNRPREGEQAPEQPGPPLEVPQPRRSDPDVPLQYPPDFVPAPAPPEAPPLTPPSEVPGTPAAPPEFSPAIPSEMPQRGGSEINFP